MNHGSERWAISSGIAVAVLFALGVITAFSGLPNYDNKDPIDKVNKTIQDAYADSGKRAAVIVGAYLIVLSALALLWFATGLRARMTRLGAPPIARDLMFAAAVFGATLIAAGGLALASIAGDLSIGNDPPISSVDAERLIPELGFPLILIGGMLAVALMITIATVGALRAELLPRWLGYAGWVAVLAAVLAILFLPTIIVLLWFLLVGIVAALGRLPEPDAASST